MNKGPLHHIDTLNTYLRVLVHMRDVNQFKVGLVLTDSYQIGNMTVEQAQSVSMK